MSFSRLESYGRFFILKNYLLTNDRKFRLTRYAIILDIFTIWNFDYSQLCPDFASKVALAT